MQLFTKILTSLTLFSLLAFAPVKKLESREFSGHKNVYVTEWSKLKHKAEQGDPKALFALGNFYFDPPKGSQFRRNYKKAAELYFQSSIREYPSAQYNIALMLHQGIGFKIDKVESYVWFYFASVNPSPVARGVNAKTAAVVEQLKQEMSEQQMSDAEKRIVHYQQVFSSKRYRDAKIPRLN